MTKAEIILNNSVFLMEQGVLKETDQRIQFKDEDGKVREVALPEPIHTYAAWKKLGFQVKRGEHAVAKFPVWKFVAGKKKEEELEEGQELKSGRCYMRVAFFFTADQVEKCQ